MLDLSDKKTTGRMMYEPYQVYKIIMLKEIAKNVQINHASIGETVNLHIFYNMTSISFFM